VLESTPSLIRLNLSQTYTLPVTHIRKTVASVVELDLVPNAGDASRPVLIAEHRDLWNGHAVADLDKHPRNPYTLAKAYMKRANGFVVGKIINTDSY
jgi:hypothetical protein